MPMRKVFNATVRMECLGRHWFLDLDDAREKVEEWRTEYNEARPHVQSVTGRRRPWSISLGKLPGHHQVTYSRKVRPRITGNSNIASWPGGKRSMKKSRLSEQQIAFVLRQAEEGTAVAEGVPKGRDQRGYNWRKKYGGLCRRR